MKGAKCAYACYITSWETDENKASAVPFLYDWPLFLAGTYVFTLVVGDAVIYIIMEWIISLHIEANA